MKTLNQVIPDQIDDISELDKLVLELMSREELLCKGDFCGLQANLI